MNFIPEILSFELVFCKLFSTVNSSSGFHAVELECDFPCLLQVMCSDVTHQQSTHSL